MVILLCICVNINNDTKSFSVCSHFTLRWTRVKHQYSATIYIRTQLLVTYEEYLIPGMSLETSGLCKLVHKKLDFYESSSRSNEPISEPSENIFNQKINQLSDSSCHLSAFNPINSLLCSCERATLLLSKYI